MLKKYEDWIEQQGYNDPSIAKYKCYSASHDMVKRFPELRIAKGYYCSNSSGTTEHWWCVTKEGEIVDPTVSQFFKIETDHYEELTDEDIDNMTVSCRECGEPFKKKELEPHGFCSLRCYGKYVGLPV